MKHPRQGQGTRHVRKKMTLDEAVEQLGCETRSQLLMLTMMAKQIKPDFPQVEYENPHTPQERERISLSPDDLWLLRDIARMEQIELKDTGLSRH